MHFLKILDTQLYFPIMSANKRIKNHIFTEPIFDRSIGCYAVRTVVKQSRNFTVLPAVSETVLNLQKVNGTKATECTTIIFQQEGRKYSAHEEAC